jgi:light-regulated signal transduction histidine kinase (bacteriophytochrome)
VKAQPTKLLLVDDDEDDYLIARGLLSDIKTQKYELKWASSYDEAVAAVPLFQPEVCLVDYHLGARNGVEFLRHLREMGCQAALVMLTGHGDREVDMEAMEAGASDYLAKGKIDSLLLERAIRYAIDRKRNELALAEQARALARSNTELEDFAYIASHDMKEPLRGIRNYADFFIEDHGAKVGDEGLQQLQTIVRLTKRMEDLIETLLHYSRVGRVDLAMVETDLQDIMVEVLDSLQISLQEAGVEVRSPKPLPTIVCDQARVAEIFRNLVTNAMKYNDKEEKWIEIGFHANEGETAATNGHGPPSPQRKPIVFYVRDNGIGIPEKHRDSVFRIFRRLHGRDKYGGGTGAGLTVVKKVVERHEGKIWLESEVGEGTTFYFTLQQGD